MITGDVQHTGGSDAARFRVLMLATCPFPTRQGTQVLIGQLARHLRRRGHEVELLTYGLGKGDIQKHDDEVPYVIHRAPPVPGHRKLAAGPSWGRPLADALLAMRGAGLARRARLTGRPFHLVHAHNYEGGLAGAIIARSEGLPLLYHAHNLMGDELETYFEGDAVRGAARAAGALLDKTVPALADGWLSVSLHTHRRLQDLAPAVPIRAFQPPAIDYGPLAGAGEGAAELVYCGNLDGYQDVEVMLKALERLSRRREVSCAVITDDSRERWEPLVQEHCPSGAVRVISHGPFESVKPHLEGARIALLPRSVASGFPIKLINYLAAGLPVVACRGGAQHLGPEEGVETVADGDAEAMAEAISTLLDDPERRRKWSERARRASQQFTWPAQIQTIEQVYDDLVSAGRR